MRKRTDAELYLMENIPIPDYWNKYIVPMFSFTRRLDEDNLSSVCPFHKDSNPSLRFYPKTKSFYCYGCHAGGTIVDLHIRFMKIRAYSPKSLDRLSAMKDLAALYNLELPSLEYTKEQLDELATNAAYRRAIEQARLELKQKRLASINDFRKENMAILQEGSSADTLFRLDALDSTVALLLSQKVTE